MQPPSVRGTALENDTDSNRPRTIEKDEAFHLLQNPRRRAVLRYLLEGGTDGRYRMRDIAEAVAAWEHDTTVQRLTSDERSRVYIGLYQTHLPKLDDHDVIDYNQSRGHVDPRPLIDIFDPYLEDDFHSDCDQLEATAPESSTSITRTVRTLFES